MKQIVWMAVLAVLLAAAAIVCALLHETDLVIATGSAAVAAAILSTREK